jgi:hypothetical protein
MDHDEIQSKSRHHGRASHFRRRLEIQTHMHIHLLVSAGGLHESDGRWIPHLSLNKVGLIGMWRYAVISHLQLAFKAHVLTSVVRKRFLFFL